MNPTNQTESLKGCYMEVTIFNCPLNKIWEFLFTENIKCHYLKHYHSLDTTDLDGIESKNKRSNIGGREGRHT